MARHVASAVRNCLSAARSERLDRLPSVPLLSCDRIGMQDGSASDEPARGTSSHSLENAGFFATQTVTVGDVSMASVSN